MPVTREQCLDVTNSAVAFVEDWKQCVDEHHDEEEAENWKRTSESLKAATPLILAAPDLLAALLLFMEQYDGPGQDRQSRPEIGAARAAIAKATGQ